MPIFDWVLTKKVKIDKWKSEISQLGLFSRGCFRGSFFSEANLSLEMASHSARLDLIRKVKAESFSFFWPHWNRSCVRRTTASWTSTLSKFLPKSSSILITHNQYYVKCSFYNPMHSHSSWGHVEVAGSIPATLKIARERHRSFRRVAIQPFSCYLLSLSQA